MNKTMFLTVSLVAILCVILLKAPIQDPPKKKDAQSQAMTSEEMKRKNDEIQLKKIQAQLLYCEEEFKKIAQDDRLSPQETLKQLDRLKKLSEQIAKKNEKAKKLLNESILPLIKHCKKVSLGVRYKPSQH